MTCSFSYNFLLKVSLKAGFGRLRRTAASTTGKSWNSINSLESSPGYSLRSSQESVRKGAAGMP